MTEKLDIISRNEYTDCTDLLGEIVIMYKHSITDLSVILEMFGTTNDYVLINDVVEITNAKLKSFGVSGTVASIQHGSDGTGVELKVENGKPNHLYVKSKNIKRLNRQPPNITTGGFINTDGIVCQVLPLTIENLVEYGEESEIKHYNDNSISLLSEFVECRDDVVILLKYYEHSLVSCLVSGNALNEMLDVSTEILSDDDLNAHLGRFNVLMKEDKFNNSSFVVTYNDIHREDVPYIVERMQRLCGEINTSTSKSMIVQGNKLKSTVIELLKSGIIPDTIEVHELGNKVNINIDINVTF